MRMKALLASDPCLTGGFVCLFPKRLFLATSNTNTAHCVPCMRMTEE